MEQQDRYIRFDWAVKRLLRQKANFGVLEGFLTVLLGEEVKIIELLESESNQQTVDDKFNRVDIKAKTVKVKSSLLRFRILVSCITWNVSSMVLRKRSQNTSPLANATTR